MAADANKNLKYWARAVSDRGRAHGSGSFDRPRAHGRRRPHHGRLSGKNQGQTALLIYQTLDLLATAVEPTHGFVFWSNDGADGSGRARAAVTDAGIIGRDKMIFVSETF
jgi:hypothetical protein